MIRFTIYLLCLVTVIGIGDFGGQLVFPQSSSASSVDTRQGGKLYATHCVACHPKGGNIINPSVPLVGSPKLKHLDTFTKFVREPLRPDGSKGGMTAIPKEKISDQDLQQIYEYIKKELK